MLIVPQPDSLSQSYWDGALSGQLKIQCCESCGHQWHPPQPICPECHSPNYAWVPASGRGVVYSFTVVHHSAHVAVSDRVPYVVALITLEEGPRMVGNLLNCTVEQIKIGMPVKLVFEQISDDVVLPQWQPAEAAASSANTKSTGAAS
jgi:uncharacterized OB-fold protein